MTHKIEVVNCTPINDPPVQDDSRSVRLDMTIPEHFVRCSCGWASLRYAGSVFDPGNLILSHQLSVVIELFGSVFDISADVVSERPDLRKGA